MVDNLSITLLGKKENEEDSSVKTEAGDGSRDLAKPQLNGGVDAIEEPATPESASLELHQWNHPQINVWRTLTTFLGLLIMGANDAVYGALLPYLETYYDIDYTIVSLLFLSPLIGYIVSAITNNRIHMTLGQRGVAILGPGFRLTAYILISQHPPYPVLVLAFVLASFGNGLEDAAWNAWIGNMPNANEILGFLHGCYGLGGVLSPLIATIMITKAQYEWYTFYYIMIGAAVLEAICAISAFWNETGPRFRAANPRSNDKKGGRTKEALSNRVTWICASFLLIYVGIEVALGGWVVTFMIKIRHAAPFTAGMSATAFWLGITIGRIILGFITPRIGEKLAIMIYLALTLATHLCFYFIPSIPVSFVAISIEGFFLAPLFPAAVVAATKLLPRHLHVAGVGFAAAMGAAGACVAPFAVGAIAQAKGVQVLMPIVLALIVADAAIWSLLPGLKRERKEKENERGENVGNGGERTMVSLK
ncbi:hypothetical protein MMC09_004761 [Bachmanniomyces sp. S44760]|nr:hypothetical protein [Bachmanniomyces sp. S44760]